MVLRRRAGWPRARGDLDPVAQRDTHQVTQPLVVHLGAVVVAGPDADLCTGIRGPACPGRPPAGVGYQGMRQPSA